MARAPTGFPTSAPTFEHRIEAYSEKRAIVATPNIHSGGDPDDLNPTLYYNYGERAFNDIWPSMTTYVGIPFVPMINDRDLSYNFKIRPEILLGFNEPDMSTSAAYMEPAEAIQLWPQIEAKNAVRLGSPACTRRNMMNWLPSFMAGNGTYVPRVDFITVHWYQYSAAQLLQRIDETYARWGKPIWLTEFSIASWVAVPTYGTEEVIRFMEYAIPALEARPFVEKYCWYSDPFHPAIAAAALFKDGKITEAGKAYSGDYETTRTPAISPTAIPIPPTRSPTVRPTKLGETSTPTGAPNFLTRPPTHAPTAKPYRPTATPTIPNTRRPKTSKFPSVSPSQVSLAPQESSSGPSQSLVIEAATASSPFASLSGEALYGMLAGGGFLIIILFVIGCWCFLGRKGYEKATDKVNRLNLKRGVKPARLAAYENDSDDPIMSMNI